MPKKIEQTKRPEASGNRKQPDRRDVAGTEITPYRSQAMMWIELGVAATLLLLLFALHVIFFQHSGGLWRDEINGVNLIKMRSVFDIWEKLHLETFPLLWFLLLRVWVYSGLGTTDFGLRIFGLIFGLTTLGALWYAGRALGLRLPMISLVLFGLSPTAFICDWLRAYGLGVFLILLALGTMWLALQEPTPRRVAVSSVAVLLSVQCLYHNSFLILAICIGAVAVGFYRRDWKLTIFPLGSGALAVASMLPYLGIISRNNDWKGIRTIRVDLLWIADKFRQAIDPSETFLSWLWPALAMLAVSAFVWRIFAPEGSKKQRDLAVFLLTTMLVSVVSYIFFIKTLSLPTQSWYYLPLLGVLIIIIDKGIDFICGIRMFGRVIRMAAILGITGFVFMNAWNAAHTRATNMDVLAAKLQTLSHQDDFIVVSPFYLGVSFAYYYRGPTPWTTLPEISDSRIHRYDLLKIKMMETEPITPILQKMAETLRKGRRVWLVGGLNFLRPGETPAVLPPAPNSPYGWSEGIYQIAWSQQAAFTVQTHGETLGQIEIPVGTPVNQFEDVPLLVVQGWRP